jgi:iron transport multicopper oxidase
MRRDTWTIAPNGETRLRFIADNPGVWLLHCHMDWHVEAGLTVTMVEAPDKIQEQEQQFMPQMASLCQAQGIATQGNAMGNVDNWLNLTGELTEPPINHG